MIKFDVTTPTLFRSFSASEVRKYVLSLPSLFRVEGFLNSVLMSNQEHSLSSLSWVSSPSQWTQQLSRAGTRARVTRAKRVILVMQVTNNGWLASFRSNMRGIISWIRIWVRMFCHYFAQPCLLMYLNRSRRMSCQLSLHLNQSRLEITTTSFTTSIKFDRFLPSTRSNSAVWLHCAAPFAR